MKLRFKKQVSVVGRTKVDLTKTAHDSVAVEYLKISCITGYFYIVRHFEI